MSHNSSATGPLLRIAIIISAVFLLMTPAVGLPFILQAQSEPQRLTKNHEGDSFPVWNPETETIASTPILRRLRMVRKHPAASQVPFILEAQ